MAYIVPRSNGAWEIRESRLTSAGPRSRTLATFRSLTQEVIDHATARASSAPQPSELRHAAIRAGAPVETPEPEHSARVLLGALAEGRKPPAHLRRLLAASLSDEDGGLSDAEREALAWADASPERRGRALVDLLLLVDALPAPRRMPSSRFPPLRSAPAT